MQEQKFTLADGYNALLIFLDELFGNYHARISRDYADPGVLIANLNIDPECYQEWVESFKRRYESEDPQTIHLSPDEHLILTIDFLSYYRNVLGFHIDPIIDLVIAMKTNPQQESLLARLWYQAFHDRVAKGERWRREDQSPKINDYLGNIEGRTTVSYNEAATLTHCFLHTVCLDLVQKMPSTQDRIYSMLSIIEGSDDATPSDWMKCCVRTRSMPFNPQKEPSLEETFAITVAFTALHSYNFGFELNELMALLNSMRSRPQLHEKEWTLWQHELDSLKDGITIFYPTR
jgi:hypothetical protein